MIDTQDIQQAINQLKKEHSPRMVQAQSADFNRRMLDHGRFDVLVDLHLVSAKNKLKQIDSGFNHVLAKIAKKNNIALGINIERFQKASLLQKREMLPKIKQNVVLCRKYGVKLVILNSNNRSREITYLLYSLGASTGQVSHQTQYF